MRQLVIFDLDGTLALNKHRQHLVERPWADRDWNGFFDLCGLDSPNIPVIQTLFALEKAGFYIHIWSGRTDRVLSITEDWLEKNDLQHFPLKMRSEGDRTSDVDLKQMWLDESVAAGRKPMMTFDDRDKVVAMWRRNDIPCFQVAYGAF